MKTSFAFPRVITVLVLTIGLSGCSTWRKLDNTEKGAVIGTGSGAAVGAAVTGGSAAGALIGGAAGGLGGGVIGHEVDEDERDKRKR